MGHGVKCVRYLGVADVRRISDSDWDKINIRSQETVQWDATNGFTVLGGRLQPKAIDHLKEDHEFAVILEDESA